MKLVVNLIDRLKCILLWVTKKWSGLSKNKKLLAAGAPLVAFYVVCAAIIHIFPEQADILLSFVGLFGLIFFFLILLSALCMCISSCKELLIFWFLYAIIVVLPIVLILMSVLSKNIISRALIYFVFCITLTSLWCLSAGIADYDVAKMAGTIINTITTILLIAANIFLGWLQWNVAPDLPIDYGGVLYNINLMVFPIVAAGYLAMLFADGLEYYKKRVKLQEAEEINTKSKAGRFQNPKIRHSGFFVNAILDLIAIGKQNYLKTNRSCDIMKTEEREQVAAISVAEHLDQKHLKDLERIKRFRLMDDDFMTLCFENEPACAELVLRIVLEKPDLMVTDVHTQVFVENLEDRFVRLDVLATDSAGARYNIEIQRSDQGAGRRRARYHASMVDVNSLEKGGDFKALPEVYVIFITERDVLGGGRPLYRVERQIEEIGEPFGDGSHIVYVNGAYQDETPIGKLMHDFACEDPGEMHYGVLADRVRFFKKTKEGSATMCKIMEDIHNEGIKEGIKETVLRMLRDGSLALEKIAELAGLSPEEVQQLKIQAGI